jgi:adenylyltransferase/sulfurtransferase
VLPGIVGTIQATEAIKLILGEGDPLIGRLLLFDAMRMKFRELRLRKDPDCPVCGTHPTITKLIDYEQFCGITPPQAQAGLSPEWEISVKELQARLDRGEHPYILDVRNPEEWQIARLDGAHLIPLGELPQRMGELDPTQEIIIHCKSGKRSQKALEFLRDEAGFRKLKNLKGGIDAWAVEVDPSVPRY